jgi:uncharacterized protein (TIRG00374 family)
MRITRRVLFWVLPPLILYLVFKRIDLERLGQLVSNANVFLILAGMAMIVLVVATGALRWHFLLRHYNCASSPLATSIGEYWKSLAVGVLAPGSLGSDAYRVMVLGKQKGYYLRSAFVIGVEKLAALFTCAILIVGLYPLLTPNHLPSVVAQIVDALYVIFLVGIAIGISVILNRRQSWGRRLAEAFNASLESLARRVASFAPTTPPPEDRKSRTGLDLMLSMFSPTVALPVLALSVAIPLISATQSQLYFQSLGYDVPFSVNLFVTPLLFLLFALPFSFGGIGIREGAFVLLYGAFGVPAEIALVVSFCSLLSILFGYAIGASLFLLSKRRQQTDDVPVVLNPSVLNSKK